MRELKRRWIACKYRCLLTICPFCSVSAFYSPYMPVLKCLMSRLLDTSVLHTEMLGCPISLEYQRQDNFLLHLPPLVRPLRRWLMSPPCQDVRSCSVVIEIGMRLRGLHALGHVKDDSFTYAVQFSLLRQRKLPMDSNSSVHTST